MRYGNVQSVDQVTTKDGDNAWQVITDAKNVGADGKNRCAIYVSRDGPKPPLGVCITWGPHHAWWDTVKVPKLGFEFAPDDPSLYTG